jgi:hypothetical protein
MTSKLPSNMYLCKYRDIHKYSYICTCIYVCIYTFVIYV